MAATRRVNSSSIDATMAARRVQENVTKSLVNYVEDNTRLQIAATSENSLSQRRRMNNSLKLQNERRIKELQEDRAVADYAQSYEQAQAAALASVLEQRAAERERKEREVRRICDESEELKELERKLKLAYMNRERAAQHEERVVAERRNELRERAMEEQMEFDRRAAIQADEDKASHSKDHMFKQKEALQVQMLEREQMKAEAQLEAERDRELVDAVVQKIFHEDREEQLERTRRKVETQKAIKDYEVQRKRELIEKREEARREEAEIQNHADALARREGDLQRLKAEKKARDAANFAKIVAETERARAEEDELDALRDLLWAEEMEAQRRREEEEREAKRQRSKQEMAKANAEMLIKKEEQRKLDVAEEERLVELMRAKFAQDEANERTLKQRRAEQTAKYVSAVKAQKAERNAMYQAAKKVELDAAQEAAKTEEYRLRVVAEARRRLLEQHAKNLTGFLPKGIEPI